MDSYFFVLNDQVTSEVDARDISVKFINFEMRYDKLNIPLMEAFNLTPLLDKELDKLALKFLGFRRLFPHVNKVLQKIDEKYPFSMPCG